MTILLDENYWQPSEVESLEKAAWEVVKSTKNNSVIAGPGAGKTELLAQKASFLLQTGKSPWPRRILAISYKKDSANNLKDRVVKRCGPELSSRFESLTFDKFSKLLVDRYNLGLPNVWRPVDYKLGNPKKNDLDLFLKSIKDRNKTTKTYKDQVEPKFDSFIPTYVTGFELPPEGIVPTNLWEYAGAQWWKISLDGAKNIFPLTFSMLERLSQLMLRMNPHVKKALQMTYSHVFMDEFQDTTEPQYSLVLTAFRNTPVVITAVGDKKQRIMHWAGAMPDAFEKFERDFNATRYSLISNYRSSPELVKIQHVLAQRIDKDYKQVESKTDSKFSTDHCLIYEFDTIERELSFITEKVAYDLVNRVLKPRDFAVIVRQKPQDYYHKLEKAFSLHGIKLRNEGEMQDLLAERITQLIIPFLRLGTARRSGKFWSKCLELSRSVKSWGLETRSFEIQTRTVKLHTSLLKSMDPWPPNLSEINEIIDNIINYFTKENIMAIYPEYSREDLMQEIIDRIVANLAISCSKSTNWIAALDDFEGLDSIPLLTIHKSKGLEYDTVVFIGLDDQAWWNFPKDTEESISAFFVAFSRAKQMVIFTYCKERGSQKNISSLYELLYSSGVQKLAIQGDP